MSLYTNRWKRSTRLSESYAAPKMREAIQTSDKLERLENMDAVELETKEHFAEIYPEGSKDIDSVLYNITKVYVRAMILDEGIRPDNRKLTKRSDLYGVNLLYCRGLMEADSSERVADSGSLYMPHWLLPASPRP